MADAEATARTAHRTQRRSQRPWCGPKLVVEGVADLLEAEDELAQLLHGAAEGVDVALSGAWCSALVVRAKAQRDGLVVRATGVGLELVVE